MSRLDDEDLPRTNVWRYLSWVFLVSIPFWVIGGLVAKQFMPGLPVSSLMVICPVAVAAVFVVRDQGVNGFRIFLSRAFDAHKLKAWAWVLALFTMPVVMGLSGVWLTLLGDGLPPFEFDPFQALVLFCLFFIAATAEELGWTGYATEPLTRSFGTILAGIVLGFLAALWHVLPLLQADRAWTWIAWWFVGTISRRVLIVWIYQRGGQSVFGASLFHTMSNLTWMLFPVMGSHYNPMVTASVMLMVTVIVLLGDRMLFADRQKHN